MPDRAEQFDPVSKSDTTHTNWELTTDDGHLLSAEPKSSAIKDFCLPVLDLVKEHPVATTACVVAAAAGGYRFLSRAADRTLAGALEATAANSELRIGHGLLLDANNAISSKAREAYASDLMRAAVLPKSTLGLADESIDQFSARQLTRRAAITGESVTADSIVQEASRIASLNKNLLSELSTGGQVNLSGRNLITMNQEHFARLAEKMQVKHMPPVEQFLNSTTPASVASRSELKLAAASQSELNAALKVLREKFLVIEKAHATKM